LIEEAGGFIVDPPLDLPSGSRTCLFNEPSDVTLAMIQPAPKT
jgi:predicted enzyme related to lactoylglutathione lyase